MANIRRQEAADQTAVDNRQKANRQTAGRDRQAVDSSRQQTETDRDRMLLQAETGINQELHC